tara:strand:- start:230 stop:1123 length:894 start_codon:yes stop_codon:yes gene_type:complete
MSAPDKSLRLVVPVEIGHGVTPRMSVGMRPELVWLQPEDLYVDTRYQRDIGRRGAANIRLIVEHFDWAKFGVLTCVRCKLSETEVAIAIVDGQHRATAAVMHPRVDKVPCWITEATFEDQARAFVAINSAVTRMTSLQMFHAALACGDPEMATIERACRKADVTVTRYPVSRENLKPGETIAAGAIRQTVARYGPGPLRIALTALRAQDDCGGLIAAAPVKGIASVVSQLDWRRQGAGILEQLGTIELAGVEDAADIARRTLGGGTVKHYVAKLSALVDWSAFKPSDATNAGAEAAA